MGWFGGSSDNAAEVPKEQPEKSKKKICCACPDTKRARDECTVMHGPDSAQCKALIEKHKQCLRSEGFQV